MAILIRGVPVQIEAAAGDATLVKLGSQVIRVPAGASVRAAVEFHLRNVATPELIQRTFELARIHGLEVRRVTVRSQRSRWGSCSRAKSISLNWRLIQAPEFVRDYIILHELMHLREMNHSAKFWAHVAEVCPTYEEAERWLRRNAVLLR